MACNNVIGMTTHACPDLALLLLRTCSLMDPGVSHWHLWHHHMLCTIPAYCSGHTHTTASVHAPLSLTSPEVLCMCVRSITVL